jgi:glutamine synthetase
VDDGKLADKIARFYIPTGGGMNWMDKIPAAPRGPTSTRTALNEVECVIADFPGIARVRAVPAANWDRSSYFHLAEPIFFAEPSTRLVEAATDGFTEPDMILRPDLATATAAPWAVDGTLQVIHDAYGHAGQPHRRGPPATCFAGWSTSTTPAAGPPSSRPRWSSTSWARTSDPAKEIMPMMGRTGRPAAARRPIP